MGSVKDLIITKKATKDRCGVGRFVFSDRYSVFDWGEMPDLIPHKGEALTLLTAYFFELLEREGIKTHYRGIVTEGRTVRLPALARPEHTLEVKLVRVVRPRLRTDHSYDYAPFREEHGNLLIPLEIIYRNYLPDGSSFVRRVQDGSILLKDYGLDKIPHAEDPLPHPIFDFSTKLEPTDRYLSPKEAQDISGLSQDAFRSCQEILQKVNSLISRELTRAGGVNVDGKMSSDSMKKGGSWWWMLWGPPMSAVSISGDFMPVRKWPGCITGRPSGTGKWRLPRRGIGRPGKHGCARPPRPCPRVCAPSFR